MLYSATKYGNTVVELAVKGRVKNLNVEFETFGKQLNELGHSILSSHTILCCEPDIRIFLLSLSNNSFCPVIDNGEA